MDDPYYAFVEQYWTSIMMVYRQFAREQPIILFDVQEVRVYAYPYDAFKADLSASSQAILKEQYEQALRDRKFVVFVRDNVNRKLVSYAVNDGEVQAGQPNAAPA